MFRQMQLTATLAALTVFAFVASSQAQDYDGDAETQITGLSGISGLSGLSALANGVVSGYAPMGANSEMGGSAEAMIQNQGERPNLGSAETSEVEAGDYDDDSNDSSASEEHPILSKFFNLISGGRHRRSVDQYEAPIESHERVKRHAKGYVPYVSTYVKTDKKANFKWGVSTMEIRCCDIEYRVLS